MKRYYFFLFLFFSGCNSLLTFQDADIVEQGKTRVTTFGAMTHSIPPDTENSYYEFGNFFLPGILVKKGITEKSEINALITPFSLNLNLKKLIAKNDRRIVSYSLGSGYYFFASSPDDQLHFWDIPLSGYLTYRPGNFFGITLAPKVIPRFVNLEFSLVTGSSLILSFGKKSRLLLEGGGFYAPLEQATFFSYGIGMGF